ncbi:MAG: ABC transporter permease [Sulfuritalea sp.]|nr:ABC transporter permease [Sulfuritalea sp.]
MRHTIIYTSRGPHTESSGEKNDRHRFRILRWMLTELIDSRELIWRLFWRDFHARYRQSFLGVTWVILQPLFLVTVFVVMNQAGIFVAAGLELPYVPYALAGLTLWQIFSGGVSACSVALTDAGSMIGKVNFPRSALVFAAFGQAAAEFVIRVMLTALACTWYGLVPNGPGLAFAFFALVPLCLLALGLGFVLAIAAALFRDTVSAAALGLSGLLLLTPILYPLRADSLLGAINVLNPVNYLINVPRDFALLGRSSDFVPFMFSSIFAFLVFAVGWRFFFVAQPHIAERV